MARHAGSRESAGRGWRLRSRLRHPHGTETIPCKRVHEASGYSTSQPRPAPPARRRRHRPLCWGRESCLLTWAPSRFPGRTDSASTSGLSSAARSSRPPPPGRALPTCLARPRVPAEQQRQQQRAPRSAPGPHAPAAGLGSLSPGALSLAPASPPPPPPPPPPPRRPPRRPAAPARALRGGSGSQAVRRAAWRSERGGCPVPGPEPGSGAPLSALFGLRAPSAPRAPAPRLRSCATEGSALSGARSGRRRTVRVRVRASPRPAAPRGPGALAGPRRLPQCQRRCALARLSRPARAGRD